MLGLRGRDPRLLGEAAAAFRRQRAPGYGGRHSRLTHARAAGRQRQVGSGPRLRLGDPAPRLAGAAVTAEPAGLTEGAGAGGAAQSPRGPAQRGSSGEAKPTARRGGAKRAQESLPGGPGGYRPPLLLLPRPSLLLPPPPPPLPPPPPPGSVLQFRERRKCVCVAREGEH